MSSPRGQIVLLPKTAEFARFSTIFYPIVFPIPPVYRTVLNPSFGLCHICRLSACTILKALTSKGFPLEIMELVCDFIWIRVNNILADDAPRQPHPHSVYPHLAFDVLDVAHEDYGAHYHWQNRCESSYPVPFPFGIGTRPGKRRRIFYEQ